MTDTRYAEHRPIDRGMTLLHGHIHDAWKMNGPRMINVGVDVWDMAPVSEDELVELIRRGNGPGPLPVGRR